MARYERSIKLAFDKLSGEILDADDKFDIKKDAFEIRRQYHKKNVLPTCLECEQDLIISGSKYDRLHFKHKPRHDYCILSDGQLSPEEQELFAEILKSKESDRHKELKNRIGNSLINLEGVDKESIAIDNKFIIRGNEKRRPDVYCIYQGRELVFEIQLSDLSLGYILSRYEFYRKHGMYLIWILDNFDIHNQGTLEKDIKYLTKYENFFKLDEEYDEFYMECDYKTPYLTFDNKVKIKWQNTTISLSQLKFDVKDFQAYYYNFDEWKEKIAIEQKNKAAEIKEAEKQRIEKEKEIAAQKIATKIISKISHLRELKSVSFNSAMELVNDLNDYEVKILNKELGLTNKIKYPEPPIYRWLRNASVDDIPFIEFILDCRRIDLYVNQTDKSGITPLQILLGMKHIGLYDPIVALFKRGYNFTNSDREFILNLNLENERKYEVYIYEFCSRLINRNLVYSVFKYYKVLFIIESARIKEIIGFNFKKDDWIAFANNAIQYYGDYWGYIEKAFKGFGLWEILMNADKKGSFEKKLKEYDSNMIKQKYEFQDVYRDLYPELQNINYHAQ